MKKGEKERKKYIYILLLFKQTKKKVCYYFFSPGRKVRKRKSSRGWEETRPLGLGVPTFTTSHCEIAGAHNCLL
jgi:hypothetical protein